MNKIRESSKKKGINNFFLNIFIFINYLFYLLEGKQNEELQKSADHLKNTNNKLEKWKLNKKQKGY